MTEDNKPQNQWKIATKKPVKKRHMCVECKYFHRDFIHRRITLQMLCLNKAGYCMNRPPAPWHLAEDSDIFGEVAIPPLVYEDSLCRDFEEA